MFRIDLVVYVSIKSDIGKELKKKKIKKII